METYTYNTATGPVTIEVEGVWQKKLTDADLAETNNNRKQTRADHKYAPGEPLSLNERAYEDGDWAEDRCDGIGAVEFSVDFERALSVLTELQRRYFEMYRLEGYSYMEIARHHGKNEATIREAIRAAEKKIKNIFG